MTGFSGSDEQLLEHLAAFKIVGGAKKETMARLLPFVRRMELSSLDYMTIRDLVEIGQCRGMWHWSSC